MEQHLRARNWPKPAIIFQEAPLTMGLNKAEEIILAALDAWKAPTPEIAADRNKILLEKFADCAKPDSFWHDAASTAFKDFFTWGHDHDFGFGVTRSGAMGRRHIEISSEATSRGFLPQNLSGLSVLDIGCWSGGDLLILAGMGADVMALEEHPRSAASAKCLCDLVGCKAEIVQQSLYQDRPEWAQRFDIIYCSGVIYHVTDPLLFMRICFAYLKPGGRLIIETKADLGDGSLCGYSGTLEKGWNRFAPTWDALGRWFVDVGFETKQTLLYKRPVGRLLACGVKSNTRVLPEPAGFSRPGSWLEQEV